MTTPISSSSSSPSPSTTNVEGIMGTNDTINNSNNNNNIQVESSTPIGHQRDELLKGLIQGSIPKVCVVILFLFLSLFQHPGSQLSITDREGPWGGSHGLLDVSSPPHFSQKCKGAPYPKGVWFSTFWLFTPPTP